MLEEQLYVHDYMYNKHVATSEEHMCTDDM